MATEAPQRPRITRELLLAAFAGPTSAEAEDPGLLDRVSASIIEETVQPGHVLFREGDDSEYVHFMSEGRMRLTRAGYADWVYDGRWVVGTTDILAERRRTRTATMETASRLFRLPASRWFEAMRDRPEVLMNVVVNFARGNVALYSRLAPEPAFAQPEAHRIDVSSLAGRVFLLASIPLFRRVPVQVLVELASLAELRDLAPGQGLFAPGVPPGRIFVVTRGRVEAARDEPAARAFFGPGAIVAGAVCLGDAEGAWRASAVDHSQVLSFATEDLFDHIEAHHGGLRAMMGAIAVERDQLCEILAARLGELVLR
jgi:CRP-like cAMP-binding protein